MKFEKNVRIYVLRDPETREIRYVGKTVGSLEKRLSEHLKYNGADHRSFWIQSLLKQGLEPLIEQVDLCYDCEWQEKEAMWIRQCKTYGYDLTNGTEGGDGCTGWKHTEESRKNLSKALKGRVFTEEWKQKLKEGQARANNDPEVRKRKSSGQKGCKRNLSDEQRKRKSEISTQTNLRRWHPNAYGKNNCT